MGILVLRAAVGWSVDSNHAIGAGQQTALTLSWRFSANEFAP
jgi:hypothetical protein